MISILREITKSWIFQLVLVLIMASFAIYGVKDVFGPRIDNAVIVAGGRTVTTQDYKRYFDNWKRQYTAQNPGKSVDAQEFVNAGAHVDLLRELADQAGLSAWLDKLGVRPSAKLLGSQLAKDPQFADPVTGHFDKIAFATYLGRAGIDRKVFEQEFADNIATVQYSDGALSGVAAPRIASVIYATYVSQKRDASVFMLTPDSVAKPAAPTDADLMTFYKDHTQELSRPELRQAVLVKFDPAEIAPTIPADEDALKALYAKQQATLGSPEQRSFVEVTAPDGAAAGAISAALKAGQSPDAAAKAHGGKVIQYAGKAKADVPDAKMADAAFALKAGEVSGPVSGDFGLGVVKVTDIKPGNVPTYESVRPRLLNMYQMSKAADKISQITNDFQKAHDAGEPFDTTVQKMGLKTVPLPPMTSDGRTPIQGVNYAGHMDIVNAIYGLQLNQSSDVAEAGGGQYYALKLVGLTPAGPPPFDAIKGDLAKEWTIEKLVTEIGTEADQAMARLRKGDKLEQVAADLHVTVMPLAGLDRTQASAKRADERTLGNIFGVKVGETFEAGPDRLHVVIGRLDAIHQADPATINANAVAMRARVAQSISQDLGVVSKAAVNDTLKPKTYPDLAIRALGATPPQGSSASASSKAKS